MERTQAPRPEPQERQRRSRRLSEVARRVREDAEKEPERYLDETRVPAGGE